MGKMLARNEVKVEATWNLDDLFATEQEFEAGLQDVEATGGPIDAVSRQTGRGCPCSS